MSNRTRTSPPPTGSGLDELEELEDDRPDTPLTRQRMVLRWVGLAVFVVILASVFVNLGQWQLRRLDERRANNAVTIAAEQTPIAPYTDYFTRPVADAEQWHRVRITGTFDTENQYVVRYRSNGDDSGYEIVTPLRTDEGTTVLVDRGFIKLAPGKQIPSTAPAPPTGTVVIVGHVRRNENGRTGATVPHQGQIRLINAPKIAETLPYPIADGYIGLITVDPAQSGGFVPVEVPELSDGPHFWYAMQWFMFTVIGVLGVVVFIRSDLRDRRRAAQRAASASVVSGVCGVSGAHVDDEPSAQCDDVVAG